MKQTNNTLIPSGKVKKIFRIFCICVMVFAMMGAFAVTTFAVDDPLTVVNNLSDFIFGLIRAVGIILLLIVILSLIGLDRFGGTGKRLRILIPESLDYDGVFEPVLKKYCRYSHLNRIKTQDYGTLLELDYRIVMKDKKQEKEFLDELRMRNGNLNISLVQNTMETL